MKKQRPSRRSSDGGNGGNFCHAPRAHQQQEHIRIIVSVFLLYFQPELLRVQLRGQACAREWRGGLREDRNMKSM